MDSYSSNQNNFLSSKILVFIATYNEVGNVGSLIDNIWRVVPEADVLVIDDNSNDGTQEVLANIAKDKTQLTVIHRPRKLGLGSAHHLAMIYAIKHYYDVLITMDADHSHDPIDMPKLINQLNEVDFVIGSRYMPGGKCDYQGYRKFLSVSANKFARLLLGIKLHEFTTSYRAFRVKALARVNFRKMHNQGYSFFMESIYRFQQAGLTLAEIPINFYSRNTGNSKIPRFEIVRGMTKLVHLVASRLSRRKMPPGFLLTSDCCANCQSDFLSVYYPRQFKAAPYGNQSNAVRCSSMTHANKPTVAKCLQCGFVQVPRSDQLTNLEELYEDVVDHDYLNNIPAKRKTFAHAYQSIGSFLPVKGDMLEVGSYCGLFLNEAQKRGWKVVGIEPSQWAADHAKNKFGQTIFSGSLEAVSPTIDQKFDVVVTWDVLEHVRDPAHYLKIINSMMKENGTLALSTLDVNSWFPRLMGRFWPWIMEMHLFYFDSNVLKDIFNQAGFEVLKVKPYRHYASIRYIYKKICAVFPANISRILLKASIIVPEIVIPVTFGDVKLYIARKSLR